MKDPIDAVCDICGKPATGWAIDVFRHEPPGAMWVEWSPCPGPPHYGCDDHQATSEEFLTATERPKTDPA